MSLGEIRVRGLGYGRNDLGDRVCDFVWKIDQQDFLKIAENKIDEFIQECIADDQNQDEPDIPFLYELNYPSATQLANNNPKEFTDLIYDYPDLAIYPFFDTPYIGKPRNIKSGFTINQVDKVYIENNIIIFEGKGGYFNID